MVLPAGQWLLLAYRAADGSTGTLPLYLSAAACGFPSPADDFIERELNLHDHVVQHPAATFFLRADGDSMVASGIHPGAILVVDRAERPQPGRVVVAVVEGEYTVKRLQRIGGTMWLCPDSEMYPRIEVSEGVTIWGVVTWVAHQP